MLRNSPIADHNITQSHLPHEAGEEESNVHYAFWIMALINVRTDYNIIRCAVDI